MDGDLEPANKKERGIKKKQAHTSLGLAKSDEWI